MGMSKVYRGYVIEDVDGQYYIHNAPNFTNGVPFKPGPHGGWSVATHQVDILINHMNRDADRDKGKYQHQENTTQYSGGYSDDDDDSNDVFWFYLGSFALAAFIGIIWDFVKGLFS